MKMNVIVVALLTGWVFCAHSQTSGLPYGKRSGAQNGEESNLDSEVYDAVLRCVHYDDAKAGVDSLLEKGLSKEMLADALCRAAVKVQNAPLRSEDSAQFGVAIYWFGELAADLQLTNAVNIALSSTNSYHAAEAVLCYHGRKRHTRDFIAVADRLLSRTSIGRHCRMMVWNCLTKECAEEYPDKAVIKSDVVRIARKHLLDMNEGIWNADELLLKYDATYADSPLRQDVARRVRAQAATLPNAVVEKFAQMPVEGASR